MCTNSECVPIVREGGLAIFVTTSCVCCNSVFSIASSDDEMKDLLLLRRIRMLSWLEPVHLDLALNLDNMEVQGMVSKGREGVCG